MKKIRKACLPIILLALLFFTCIGLISTFAALFGLPKQAEAEFGPASTRLSPFERSYLSAFLLLYRNELTQALDPSGLERPFQIDVGETTYNIASRLQYEGFIPHSEAFRTYLKYAGLDTTLQAGKYTISPAMTPIEIAAILQDATPSVITFNILPGWRLEEIADALPTSGLGFSKGEFALATSFHPLGYSFFADLPPTATLEGFLFPDTYQLPRDLSAGEFVNTILNNFEAKVDNQIREGFSEQGLNLYQGVTLASMVEREAIVKDEMPTIASVFLNRLNTGMKLDSDPTVQYALGYNSRQKTWWTNPLSAEDLQVNSSYNTYQVTGLPPGPISNPSLEAMRAVAFPAQTSYFYFRAACDQSGRHRFAETLQGQIQNACP